MRTIGFLFVVLGGLLAYLGLQGKVGQAWNALLMKPTTTSGMGDYNHTDNSGGL
jgi:hypothetical protein